MKKVVLDLERMGSGEEVYAFLKKELKFSEDFGGSPEELYAEFLEMGENVCLEVVRAPRGSSMTEIEKELEGVMERAAQTVDHSEEGRIFAIFAGYEFLEPGPWQ